METLTLTTPSILFSAISLIMLAHTNRFLAYAQVIRNLKAEHESHPTPITQMQMDNLRKRLYMARAMQIFGVSSLLLCVVCTFLIYVGFQTAAAWIFATALLLLTISLGISVQEIRISVQALEVHLDAVSITDEICRKAGHRPSGKSPSAQAAATAVPPARRRRRKKKPASATSAPETK